MASKFWVSSSGGSDESSHSVGGEDRDDGANDDWSTSTPLPPPDQPDRIWRNIERDQPFKDVPTVTSSSKSRESLRIVCISDTHGKHRSIAIPPADVLIHAGDLTKSGELGTLADMVAYFEELKTSGVIRKQVIFIAGNHDLTLDPPHYEENWKRFHRRNKLDSDRARSIVRDTFHALYLEDSSTTLTTTTSEKDKNALLVYGSPHTPFFFDWAFNQIRGDASTKQIWGKIPSETDILITHGPPLGRGDECSSDFRHVGCHDLLQELQRREHRPRLHVFGHVHEGYGSTFDGQTLFVNASSLTFHYKPLNPVIVIELPYDKRQPARIVKPDRCPVQSGEQFAPWLEANGFPNIAKHCVGVALDRVPVGNNLIRGEDAYLEVIEALPGLARDVSARIELIFALSKLQAQSY